jgi:hypothetical protein
LGTSVSPWAWVEEWDGGDYKVGTVEYFACKRAAVKAFQENCLGFHAEAFETWIGKKYGQTDSAHGDMVAYRDMLWRNMRALHRRPHSILQIGAYTRPRLSST